uniref:P-loop containing nucleoside triphosphate hydrolase protein n=1 Tax=Heterorhabditis bacteriophora TaxID=37862 RepID=A0A1I7XU29_HETBA
MPNLTDVPVVKCIVVGNDEAGKTSMMKKYAEISGLPFNNEHKEIVTAFNGQKCVFVQLSSDSEDENRPFYDAHVFLICIMGTIIENIRDVPFVLIGTQIDKRLSTPINNYGEEDKGFLPMPLNQAESFAKTIGASKYLECSATTGVRTVLF